MLGGALLLGRLTTTRMLNVGLPGATPVTPWRRTVVTPSRSDNSILSAMIYEPFGLMHHRTLSGREAILLPDGGFGGGPPIYRDNPPRGHAPSGWRGLTRIQDGFNLLDPSFQI